MATGTLTPSKAKAPRAGGGGRGPDDSSRRGGGGDDGREPERRPPPEGYGLGVWLAIVSITMMFLAFTSAYIVNRAKSFPIIVPPILWVSTAVILGCSLAIELARRALRRRFESKFLRWMWGTLGLGLVFLVAQVMAWRQLTASGFYINTNQHSFYAYTLTALHGLHLIGGLLALAYVIWRVWRGNWTALRRRVSVDATAVYWHFLDGLWIYLFVLLFFWR